MDNNDELAPAPQKDKKNERECNTKWEKRIPSQASNEPRRVRTAIKKLDWVSGQTQQSFIINALAGVGIV